MSTERRPGLAFATALVDNVHVLDLAYQAEAPGCPDASEFAAMVAHQSGDRVAASPAPLAVEVALAAAEGGFVGELVLRSSSAPTSRRIQAATCEQAAEALALVVALAHEQEEQERTAAQRGTDPRRSTPPAQPSALGSGEEPRPLPHAALVGASVTWAMSPDVSPGFGLALERELHGWLSVRVLGRYHAWTGTESSAGSTSFRRVVGGGAAVAHWAVLPSWALLAAVETQAGRYSADGTGDQGSRTADAPWLSLGGWLGLRWTPGPLLLELHGGVEAPVTRPTVYFEPRREVFRPPPAAAHGELSAGVRF